MQKLFHGRKLATMVAGAVLLAFGVFGFGGPAVAGPGDQACEDGRSAEHNPNCEDGELVTPVCDTPAGDHNPFCEDGDGPPPEDPPNDTPGGDEADNGNGDNGDECVEDGTASQPVHDSVEPGVGQIDPALQDGVHQVNCGVVVPVEDALGL